MHSFKNRAKHWNLSYWSLKIKTAIDFWRVKGGIILLCDTCILSCGQDKKKIWKPQLRKISVFGDNS